MSRRGLRRSDEMNLESLQKIDSRWIFLAVLLAVALPIVFPIGLPLKISDNTRKVYDAVAAVPVGGIVVITPDCSYDSRGELLPMMEVFLRHLFTMNVKVVSVSTYGASSPMLIEEAMKSVGLEAYGKKYGVDFVNLGYLAGDESTIAAFGADVHALVTVDYYGTPISQLPIMDGLRTAKDISLAISVSEGRGYPEMLLRQWQSTYGTKMTGGSVGLIYASTMPYIASGQLTGYLPSMRGTAEYELLSKRPASAIIGMDSQSLVHIVFISVIVICNIGVFGSYLKSRRVTKA